jgi:hypothetical protein
MALKAVAGGSSGGGGDLVGSAGAFSIQLSNAAGAVINGNYFISLLAPFDMTLDEIAVSVDSGSFDMVLNISGIPVTGSAVTVSAATTHSLTAANTAFVGDEINLVVTNSTGNPPNANVQVLFTRDSV